MVKSSLVDIDGINELFPISDGKIKLSVFAKSDLSERYIGWLNDKEVVRFSNQRFKKHTLESCHNYLDSFSYSQGIFIRITDLKNDSMIGTMTIYPNKNHSVADIGIMIGDRSVWGRGFGGDAWTLVLSTLFGRTKLRKITGGTLSCNIGMLKIMQNSGMVEDGIRIKHEIIDGEAHDVVHMAKFR